MYDTYSDYLNLPLTITFEEAQELHKEILEQIKGDEDGMELYLRVGDFFSHQWQENTAYELRIYSDKGLVYKSLFNGKETQKIALKCQKRAFYRAEVVDLTHGYRVAVGNPIWLDK